MTHKTQVPHLPSPFLGIMVMPALMAVYTTSVWAIQDESVTEDHLASAENPQQDASSSKPEMINPKENEPEVVELGKEKKATTPAVSWVEEPIEPALADTGISRSDSENPLHGPRYVLERVEIQGNKKSARQVILRYIEIQPGEVFSADDIRLEKARYRLLASGFFLVVEFSLKRGSRRGGAILVVEVKERNTFVVQDMVFGWSRNITPFYGSLDVAERSVLGFGVNVSTAAVISKEQFGWRLRYGDDHLLNSDFGIRAEGLFAKARDFFGNKNVCVNDCSNIPGETDQDYDDYAEMQYTRAGLRLGTGYTLLGDNFFSIDYHFEVIEANVPASGSHTSFSERQPIVFGHLLPGHSLLSSLILGVVRDTRDSFILASKGSRTAFEVKLSTEVIGSDYDFSKFTLAHDIYFPLGRGHSLKLGLFVGLIMGNAPFFNQFFVGDFSAFVPSRVLEMNFSHHQPNLLNTSIVEMRYEDLAASIGIEYSLPFYRGHGFFYGVNGFVGLGVFSLASRENLKTDPKGYHGYEVIPMDLTIDLGIKVDTEIGIFVFSLASLFRLIPFVEEVTAEP
ncbi:MAG: BamA/TamA family outer membrane protein [Proteobacteria bacterium]|nr:BamA/TamA family outer membrane protein [Pseudomonadota bacterium]